MTDQIHSCDENNPLPGFSAVSAVLAGVCPKAPTKTLARALTKTFPKWTWHIKDTDSYWYSCALGVVAADGSLVAADVKAWLQAQIALHGSGRVLDRIKTEDVRFARTGGETGFYALGYKPDQPLDFVQIHFRPTSRMVYSFPSIQARHPVRSAPHTCSSWIDLPAGKARRAGSSRLV
jgi:hypothetical protein